MCGLGSSNQHKSIEGKHGVAVILARSNYCCVASAVTKPLLELQLSTLQDRKRMTYFYFGPKTIILCSDTCTIYLFRKYSSMKEISWSYFNVHNCKQLRRNAQSCSPHRDGKAKPLKRPDYCLPNCPGWDSIGRRKPSDRYCSSGRPQRLPCSPVSMWGYCPFRRPSSTFVQFHAARFSRHAAISNIMK